MNQLFISILLLIQTSFYSLGFTASDGKPVNMQAFQGKKILLVNIATGSSGVRQLGELVQLQQQFKDSLVVIAFPSNSFGKESKSDEEIMRFCKTNYQINFLLAAKSPVAGAEIQPVYKWLTTQSENGIMEGSVSSDFQKYLISEQGALVGVFAGAITPLSEEIIMAIRTNYSN